MLVLLLLCCIPLALAEPITAGCCFPRQWTAVVMENGGIKLPTGGQEIDYLTNLYADFDKGKLRMDRNGFQGGQPVQQTLFMDYHTHMLYFAESTTCLPANFSATVPETCFSHGSYSYKGRHVIGSGGDNIVSDAWTTTVNGNITITFYVTEDCEPLIQIYTDLVSPYPTQTILTYTSFKAGVEADKLTRPSACQT